MSQENVEIVRRMVEAFNRGDVDAVTASFGEQCALHEPAETVGTPRAGFRGHDGIREWMANLRETAEIQFEPTDFITNGDSVLCEWVGRGLGQAGGVPIEWSTFVVLRLRDGKIEQALAFLSRAEALEAAAMAGEHDVLSE